MSSYILVRCYFCNRSEAVAPLLLGALLAVACSTTAIATDSPPPDASATVPGDATDATADAIPYTPHPSARSIALFDTTKVINLGLTFPAGEWTRLLTPVGPGDARYVHCAVTFEGETFPDAACRRKGNMTDWPFEKKPQIVVKFNLWTPKGRFRGLRHLNLESFDGLDAPVRDRLGMWLMREAGLDASRVSHARVSRDGAPLGLYMNIEVIDKEFLEDHFGPDSTGNLWEGGFELMTNELVNDHRRLDALHTLVENEPLVGDHAAFFAALPTMMDVAEVIREMAAETVLLVDDNFSNGSTNFDYYEHPHRGFLVIPWDLDTIITEEPPASDPFTFWAGSDPNKLRLLIDQNPAWHGQFIDDAVDIRDHVFARMPAEVDALCALVRSAVAADTNRSSTDVQDFDNDCARIKSGIAARTAALRAAFGR